MACPPFTDIRDPGARVRALCQYGCNLDDVDPTVPPKRYFRSGLEMCRMGRVYQEEGDLESAFVIYSKFISLFVEKLPKHPEYKLATPVEKKNNKEKLKSAMQSAETIKKKLTERYTLEEQRRCAEEKRQQEIAEAEAKRKQLEEEARKEEEKNNLHKQKLLEQEQHLRDLQELARKEREKELEERLRVEGPSAPPPPPYDQQDQAPTVDRTTKPDHFTSSGRATTNRYGFRDVVVPVTLIDKFLAVAFDNTEKKLETCGILTGRLSQHAFRVTHLLIPTQTGTPDSCNTDNEEDVFEYQDEHDLITLGWIHTHPTQTAFLSSVDLHTHCSYQLMMPEAVAIVCAPKFEQVGNFSLTPDYGLKFIANCRQPGFHPHPKEPPLYEDCDHVKMDNKSDVILVDLRKGAKKATNTRI